MYLNWYMRETALRSRERKREVKMSIFDEKIAAARAIIDEHNSSVEKDDQIDTEVFFKKLRTAGGTTDAALVECMWRIFRLL